MPYPADRDSFNMYTHKMGDLDLFGIAVLLRWQKCSEGLWNDSNTNIFTQHAVKGCFGNPGTWGRLFDSCSKHTCCQLNLIMLSHDLTWPRSQYNVPTVNKLYCMWACNPFPRVRIKKRRKKWYRLFVFSLNLSFFMLYNVPLRVYSKRQLCIVNVFMLQYIYVSRFKKKYIYTS